MEQLKFNFEEGRNNYSISELGPDWERVTKFEKVKKQPVFVGYDVWNNFRINFLIINRHNVLIKKSFIFPPDYPQNKRFKTDIISAEGPIGVNIFNDFKTYTEISKECFNYLYRKALAIYNSRINLNRENNQDQLEFDL